MAQDTSSDRPGAGRLSGQRRAEVPLGRPPRRRQALSGGRHAGAGGVHASSHRRRPLLPDGSTLGLSPSAHQWLTSKTALVEAVHPTFQRDLKRTGYDDYAALMTHRDVHERSTIRHAYLCMQSTSAIFSRRSRRC
jgi:hypothetical protein